MYITRKKKLGHSDKLDAIAEACGDVWCDTVRWFWRTVDRQDVWLSKYAMQRWMCTGSINGSANPIASKASRESIAQNTAQGVVNQFYDALKTWRANRGNGMRPPYKMKRYQKAQWNYTQMSIKSNEAGRFLRLSCGRGADPLMIPWPHPEPRRVEIGWDGEQYELRCQYEVEPDCEPLGDEVAGVDLGEIHLATTYTGEESIITNGRELRSKRRYQNKLKAKLDSKIDRKQRGSRRWWRLVTSKKQQLSKLRNQITDILHKQSTRLVEALHERRVCKIVIGDVRGIRNGLDYGSKGNQKLHQWASGRFRQMLTYKAEFLGMEVALEGEAYTSQTCPSCGERHKPRGREYRCRACGATYHRDAVGAMNIREKYLRPDSWTEGYHEAAVVADRTTATGEASCSSQSGKNRNGSRKPQLNLFESAAALKRETMQSDGCPVWGIRYRPHMTCGGVIPHPRG